mmetsp:Transcript_33130/g.91544  ORF Transcript_33130/g.91544 Transcript_33130/m.91544 type:complete len:200 (-) Transcript_33130:67-666(-)
MSATILSSSRRGSSMYGQERAGCAAPAASDGNRNVLMPIAPSFLSARALPMDLRTASNWVRSYIGSSGSAWVIVPCDSPWRCLESCASSSSTRKRIACRRWKSNVSSFRGRKCFPRRHLKSRHSSSSDRKQCLRTRRSKCCSTSGHPVAESSASVSDIFWEPAQTGSSLPGVPAGCRSSMVSGAPIGSKHIAMASTYAF